MVENQAVTVKIEGLPPNDNDYEDDTFLRADAHFREAAIAFWEAGARAENIEESLADALTDAI